jgi:hypothetical protein
VSALTREQARDAAREELSNPGYDDAQPPLVLRLLGRLVRELLDLLERAASATPGGAFGVLVLLTLLALLVGVVLAKVRPQRGRRRSAAVFDDATVRAAAEHRADADAAAAQGRFADAVRERLRAVVRELESRGVLDPRPGRTADEVAREAGAVVPEIADDLTRGTRLFDEVWYGGRPADASSYAVLVGVDGAVTGRRLAVR